MLVIGDVMLDRYWWGEASRLSPEAPVPVVRLDRVSDRPGGAANVAFNIASLGAHVSLAGVTGPGPAGDDLRQILRKGSIDTEHLLTSPRRKTTQKTRVMVHDHQIARVDDETNDPLTPEDEASLLDIITPLIADAGAVVLSDYAKGCLTDSLCAAVIDEAGAKNKPVIVDPKARDLSKYRKATILTPNLGEALSAAGIANGTEADAAEAAATILDLTDIGSLLITLGQHGMALFERDAEPARFASLARQVFDVTGAGDTVVAVLAAAIASGADLRSSVELSNMASGIVVEKVGTSAVTLDEIRKYAGSE